MGMISNNVKNTKYLNIMSSNLIGSFKKHYHEHTFINESDMNPILILLSVLGEILKKGI